MGFFREIKASSVFAKSQSVKLSRNLHTAIIRLRLVKMELKDDGKPKKFSWRIFRPVQNSKTTRTVRNSKPEPQSQRIILLPSTASTAPRGINQNQMERGQTSGEPKQRELNKVGKPVPEREPFKVGPWQVGISNTCITCLIIWLIVLAILFLMTLTFSIIALVVFYYNGNPMDNWNYLTTFEGQYDDGSEEMAVDSIPDY